MVARWTSDLKVRVCALARSLCCVLGQDTLLSQCLSSPRSINSIGTSKLSGKPGEMLRGYLRWANIPSRGRSNSPSRLMPRKPG